MTREQILAAIPHRPPFLLLDEIVEQTPTSIHCRYTFRPTEAFFAGHYPGFPLVPGVLLVEAGMQAGAVLLAAIAEPSDDQAPVATRINDVRFKRMVRPSEMIDIRVDLIEQLSGAFFLRAKVSVGEQSAARFEFACTMANRPGETAPAA